MTSRELLYVKTVADEKNISKAAKKLFVAQPSLSQSLQRIEDSIGTKIFVRGSSGLKLTYAGEQYYQMACKILKIYDDFENGISNINDLKAGHIRFGITTHLGGIMLPVVLPQFTKACPNIKMDIYEESTDYQEEKLISGDLDFSIMHAPVEGVERNASLNYEILAKHPFVIAIAKNNPLVKEAVPMDGYPHPVLDIKLLQDQPFMTLHKEQRIRQVTDAVFRKAHINPEIILMSRNYMTLERLAAEGVGVTLLPSDYVYFNKYTAPPAFLSVEAKYDASWSLCIETLKDSFISRADEYFLDIVRKDFTV